MPPTLTYALLRAFVVRAFHRAGVSEAEAGQAADALVTTDAWGGFEHGTVLLPGYLRRLQAGGLHANAVPHLVAEGPGWGIVDGRAGLPMTAAAFAMQKALAKSRACGIGYVGVRNSGPVGAAGYYAWQAAREGQIGLSFGNERPSLALAETRSAVIGANPVAYAIPAGRHPPLLLDTAIGAPANLEYPAAIGPLDHALALLIETLAAALSGAAFTWRIGDWNGDDAAQPTQHGGAFLAIQIGAITTAAEFARRMEAIVDELGAAPRVDGKPLPTVPGAAAWEHHRRAMRDGFLLPAEVQRALHTSATLVGLDPDEELAAAPPPA